MKTIIDTGVLVYQPEAITITEVYNASTLYAPSGYEFTMEFRTPKPEDWFLTYNRDAARTNVSEIGPRLILRPLPPRYRVIFTPIDGSPRPARNGEWYKTRNGFELFSGSGQTSLFYPIYTRTEEEIPYEK